MDKKSNLNGYIKITKDFIKRIEEKGVPVENAYIFGSRIKGTNHKWSDLDTCIISKNFGKDSVNERVFLMTVGDEVSDFIEPHPFSPKDFEDKYNSLATEIKKYGIRIK